MIENHLGADVGGDDSNDGHEDTSAGQSDWKKLEVLSQQLESEAAFD